MVVKARVKAWREWIGRAWLPRWQACSPRERMLLMAAAVLLPLAVLVFGVWLPLHDANRALRAQAADIERQAAEAERLAARIVAAGVRQGGGHGAGGAQGSLLATVERLARESGVRGAMSRIRPQPAARGERLLVEFRDVPFDALVRFVDGLARAGADLAGMRVQRAAASGRVHARAVIQGG